MTSKLRAHHRKFHASHLVLLFLLLLSLSPTFLHAAPSSKAPAKQPLASLSKAELPARGLHESILTITKFGRYAISVKSDQGTGLQLIDRMAGPGQISGAAGDKDGRLDLFLERGNYKIVTHGHEKASGTIHLDSHVFSEKNAPQPPALIEYKLIQTELKDFEQASYWLEITERKLVALEASGRSLADLRLWKDGSWLVDATPAITTIQPKPGQPLRVCRLSVELEPGLYLLSAYGGLALPWAEDSGSQPLYIRYGIPELGSSTRKRFVISPFGTDRFIVPGSSTYFRIELAEAREMSLQAGWVSGSNLFDNNGPVKSIQKNSLPPVTELTSGGNKNARHIITITGEAGTPYVFQHFESRYSYSFQGSGDYWISSVHSGHPQDSVDATAIMMTNAAGPNLPVSEQTVELDQTTGYSRRANLLDSLTLFLKIKTKGPYQIISQGAQASFRIEPFFSSPPLNYSSPKAQPSGSTFDLDPGYYELTIEPQKKGIMDLIIRPASWVSWVWGKLDLDKGKVAPALRPSVRFPRVNLNHDLWYTLYLNHQPEVRAGLVIRSLPMNLMDPLPVSQRPDEVVNVPFEISEEGTLRAEAEDGALMDLSVDNGPWQKTPSVGAGRHTVSVRSTAKDTINYALGLAPRRLETGTPLPALSETALARLPKFPVLTATKPLHFDLERNSSSTFNVQADKSGLYQIQSTGLLATEGNLRSRTTPRFVRESENGIGRNFFVRQYLNQGDYQITVSSKGQSKGHLGLTLEKSGLIQGGFLTSRIPARLSLAAGKAASYQFIISKPGDYRLRAFGLGRTLKCRLEDKDGWPVVAPNSDADISRFFAKGKYRLMVLPESTDARIVTVIEPKERVRRFKGHGPHPLPLAAAIDHTWMEPESGKTRDPDQWKFQLPADGEVSIELTGEMQADVMRVYPDGSAKRAAFISPSRGWQGFLQAGQYRIDAVSMRVNNQAPYRVTVRPLPLMAGMSRNIAIPSIVSVAIGTTGLVELSSFGSVDVKARLTTQDGIMIAENDDRPDDWNFQIVTALKPGNYKLYVEPVGTNQGDSTVSVSMPKEEEKKALTVPTSSKIKLADSVLLLPLELPATGDLLMLSARAPETIGLAVEVQDQGGWKTVGSASGRNTHIEIPLRAPASQPSNGRHRLRLWSMDRRETAADLSAMFVASHIFTEGDLKKGIDLQSSVPPTGSEPPSIAIAAVRIERGGLLRIPEEFRRLRWSTGANRPCEQSDDFLPVQQGFVWITGEIPPRGPAPSARAVRANLAPGEDKTIQVKMRGQENVLCDVQKDGPGPVLVTAFSRVGRPAVLLTEQSRIEQVNTGGLTIGEHGSLSVSLYPKDPVARLWEASPSDEPFEVRLTQTGFPLPELASAKEGLQGKLEGKKAKVFELLKGKKRIGLSLGEALVAAFVKGDSVSSVHWAEGNAFTETFETDADRLLVLHLREGEDHFAVEVARLEKTLVTPAIDVGAPFERVMLSTGRLRLSVAEGKTASDSRRTLHIRGGASALFTDTSGNVISGSDMELGKHGGTLVIEHGPGPMLAWLDSPGKEAADLWATGEKPDRISVELPALLPLDGKLRAYRIETAKPVMLHVRTATPVVTYMDRGEKTPDVEVYPQGGTLDAYLPTGAAELRLRALAGALLSGQLSLSSSEVIPTDEGLGTEVLLAPGAARLFSFTVRQEGMIGAGVKADSDTIDMELLNSEGMVLGKGVAQMLRLKPGAYLMKLQAPDAAAPVKVRPALVGLKAPDTGPPPDEIKKYLYPETEMPEAYSSRTVNAPEEGIHKKRAVRSYERPASAPEEGESIGEPDQTNEQESAEREAEE